ncbi:hypothetical protein Tco_1306100 [Tanacetum coccineum]
MARDLSEEALVVKAEVEGYLVRRIHIDEGASVEIMFGQCFNMLHPSIRERLVETTFPQQHHFGASGPKATQSHPVRHPLDDEIPNPIARSSQLWGFHSNAFLMLTRATTKYRWRRNTRRKPPSTRIKSQIGRNLEVYVDDMVVKSKSKREMLADIVETFDNLRRINMKPYPKKCSFRVLEGKFLGYMVTSEGIRANLAKTKDIAEMQSPRT